MEPELRFKILNRDRYRCKNQTCKYWEEKGIKNSSLEVHHIVEQERFRANPDLHRELGLNIDDPKNLVIVCSTCHRRYHNGFGKLLIDGKEYEVEVPTKVNWKRFKKDMRQMRKEYRHLWGKKLSSQEIILLLYFLFGDE